MVILVGEGIRDHQLRIKDGVVDADALNGMIDLGFTNLRLGPP